MSDKPVAERLEVKRGRFLAVLEASPQLDHAPGSVEARTELPAADEVLVTAPDRETLESALLIALAKARDKAIIWAAYPS